MVLNNYLFTPHLGVFIVCLCLAHGSAFRACDVHTPQLPEAEHRTQLGNTSNLKNMVLYRLKEKITWCEGFAFCENSGQTIATTVSGEEWQHLSNIIRQQNLSGDAWFGARRLRTGVRSVTEYSTNAVDITPQRGCNNSWAVKHARSGINMCDTADTACCQINDAIHQVKVRTPSRFHAQNVCYNDSGRLATDKELRGYEVKGSCYVGVYHKPWVWWVRANAYRPMIFSNWPQGELAPGDCMEIDFDAESTWKSKSCDIPVTKAVVCEDKQNNDFHWQIALVFSLFPVVLFLIALLFLFCCFLLIRKGGMRTKSSKRSRPGNFKPGSDALGNSAGNPGGEISENQTYSAVTPNADGQRWYASTIVDNANYISRDRSPASTRAQHSDHTYARTDDDRATYSHSGDRCLAGSSVDIVVVDNEMYSSV